LLDWIEAAAELVSETVNGTLLPIAEFLEDYVWWWPPEPYVPLLAMVLLGTGLYVTVRLALIQVRGFRHAVNITRGVYDNPEDEGDLKHFQALTTALSATVGIGNIAGVAIGIRLGGPGALFWMWLTAFFGMALKYVECTLAVAHRKINPDGSVSGGPMYYIELGLGRGWKWMALLFAGCAAICSFGSGCMNQSNTLADQVHSEFGIPTVYSALVFSFLVGLVIVGGIRRIGQVTSILAPAMACLYIAGAMAILLINIQSLPGDFALIFKQAFAPTSLVGGGVGSFMMTMMWGIRRGLFSNEAGQGSAPIAHATAKTDKPVREGLVASLGPFIDTLVICTMTGLVIITTGAFREKGVQKLELAELEAVHASAATDEQLLDLRDMRQSIGEARLEVAEGELRNATLFVFHSVVEDATFVDKKDRPWSGSLSVTDEGELGVIGEGKPPFVTGTALLTGAPLTAKAFKLGLPGRWGSLIVTVAVILFAVSTGISWSYYGDRATEYLLGSRAIPIYHWVFLFFFFMGAIMPLKSVWIFGDVGLGIMSFPNLIACILLTGSVVRMSKEYFSQEQKRYR
jgi:AGCS family alanine or glycine:cation symporter